MTQVVKHKSRILDYEINYSADGGLSWSFIAEGDAEIYAVESNNVASYTINGGAVSLPFDLANDVTYTVEIVKSTGGQVADITLKTRRKIDKTKSFNVPDYSVYDGRYAYCLMESTGVINIVDTGLLVESNYSGAGAWITNPVISSFTMPSPPVDFSWRALCFVKLGNQNKLVVIAGKSGNLGVYGSIVQLDNGNAIYDLSETTLNGITTVYTPQTGPTYGAKNVSYDFIKEQILIKCIGNTSGGQTDYTRAGYDFINKVNLIFSLVNFESTQENYPYGFNPFVERFTSSRTDLDLADRTYNYKPLGPGGTAGYDIDTNTSFLIQANSNWFQFYNSDGQLVVSKNPGIQVRAYACGFCIVRNGGVKSIAAIPLTINKTSFMILNYDTNQLISSDPLTDIVSGQTGFENGWLSGSDYANLFLLTGADDNDATNTGRKRLYVLEPDFTGSQIKQRYLDFVDDIEAMVTNKLLI